MVLPILLAIFFLVLLLGLAIVLLVYIPMLPLFIPVWIIELFGDVHVPTVLPVVFGIIVVGVFAWTVHERKQLPAKAAVPALLLGIALVLYGAAMFGNVWEVLQAEHQYAAQQAGFFSSSFCVDHPTGCLMEDNTYYPSQLVPALVSEVVWYLGLGITYYGFNESRWDDSLLK